MIIQSIDRNGTSATWRLLRRRNPQVLSDYFSFSAFTKIFFNFCLWGIVSFTFHCQLSSRFVYKLKRTRLYGKLVNCITVCEFDCLSNAAKNDNNREVFHQILCQLKKIIETKTQVRGQPEENARDCFQRWRLFCQQVTTSHWPKMILIEMVTKMILIGMATVLMITKRCWLHCDSFTIQSWRLPHYNPEKSKYLFFFTKSKLFLHRLYAGSSNTVAPNNSQGFQVIQFEIIASSSFIFTTTFRISLVCIIQHWFHKQLIVRTNLFSGSVRFSPSNSDGWVWASKHTVWPPGHETLQVPTLILH